jgi:hypothetical protein
MPLTTRAVSSEAGVLQAVAHHLDAYEQGLPRRSVEASTPFSWNEIKSATQTICDDGVDDM